MSSLWMLFACFMFATMGACVKLVAFNFNVGQTVLIRGLIPIVLIGAWILWRGGSLRTPHWKSHLYRSVSGSGSMLMYFAGIMMMPLATAVTLNNTSALFMAAVISLRQRPPRHIVFGLLLGLTGVALVLQPAFSRDQWLGCLLGLGGALLGCFAQLNLSELGRVGEPAWRTVFILSAVMSLLSAPLAITLPAHAESAQTQQWLLLLGVGVCGGLGQLALTQAFTQGKTLVAASMTYMTVVFSSLYGVLIWGEHLSATSWLGIVTIIGAGLVTTRPARKSALAGKPSRAEL
jgi:drug/metabolite transporter (DMT)-like permease